ncbi:MAG: peptidylprolyl isomerase [Planctomycetaceae bacterium]|nr:peptidylprolyl isomerase [Planctomycetaceae bacterium]
MNKLFITSLLAISAIVIGCSQTGNVVDPPVPTAESTGNSVPVGGDSFNVKFETSKGDVIIKVVPDWSPRGAAQFKELVETGFYDDCRFFRVIAGFMAQIGINGNPEVQAKWRDRKIPDDPVIQSNKRGFVSYAMAGPNTRTCQFFINFGDNGPSLDGQGFSPFGQVIEGMDVVDSLYSGYGEGAPRGAGPDQGRIQYEGNEYLNRDYPNLDYVIKATIVSDELAAAADSKEEPAAQDEAAATTSEETTE